MTLVTCGGVTAERKLLAELGVYPGPATLRELVSAAITVRRVEDV